MVDVDRDELEDSGMEQEPSQHMPEMESGMDVHDDRFNEDSKRARAEQDSQRASSMYQQQQQQQASEAEQSSIGRGSMSHHSFEMEPLPESPLFLLPGTGEQLPQIDLSPEALEQIAMLYDNIRDMRAKVQPG